MLIQNKIPILEYDTEPKAVIMPGVKGEPRLPERCAFLFYWMRWIHSLLNILVI